MLTELCKELRNWFDRERHEGTFTISGGVLTADFLREGQYFRVIGSVFNDGVHRWPDEPLADETFSGSVWALAIPEAVLQLSRDIDAWREKYEAVDSAAMSPYMMESFGGYSYQKGSVFTGQNIGGTASWISVFATRLKQWRKL